MSRASRSAVFTRLILLLLLAASAAWVIRLRFHRAASAPAAAAGYGSTLPDVARLVFRHRADSVVVERRGEELWLTRPFSDRGDPLFLAEVNRQARRLQPGRVLPDSDAASYGLDPPQAQLALEDPHGARWTLSLGDSVPVGSQVYARVSGRPGLILLIDRFTARTYFEPRIATLRDRVAAPLSAGPIDSLEVITPGGEVRARREGEMRWICRSPAGLRLDPAKVGPLIEILRSPSITGYPEPGRPLRSLGLDPPRATWLLWQGSRVDTVRVGNPTEDQVSFRILPARRSLPALLPTDRFRSFVDGWPALLDLHLLSIPPESLRAVAFLDDPRAGSYEQQGSHWVRNPAGDPVTGRRALEDYLRNLTRLQWRKYPAAAMTPAGARLRLALRTDARAETLSLAAPKDTIGWAKSTEMPRWGEVGADSWAIWRYRADHPE